MRALIAGLFLALTTVGVAWAQTQNAQAGQAGQNLQGNRPAPRNLQVLPKDTSPQDVLALMQQITRALGVQCTYCHVQETPPLLSAEEAAAQAAAAPPVGRGRGRGRGGPQMD
jgi:hypothetical protein